MRCQSLDCVVASARWYALHTIHVQYLTLSGHFKVKLILWNSASRAENEFIWNILQNYKYHVSFSYVYTRKTYTHNFHAIIFSYENCMKIMRISCEKLIHAYHAKKHLQFSCEKHAIIMRFSTLSKLIHFMRLSCESWKPIKIYLNGS